MALVRDHITAPLVVFLVVLPSVTTISTRGRHFTSVTGKVPACGD